MSLRAAFQRQSEACTALGSPFMGQLMRVLGEKIAPDRKLTNDIIEMPGQLGPEAASIPLRIAGALHALKLQDRAGLANVYPPNDVADEALWSAIDNALNRETQFIEEFIQCPPQTNEIRRAACLIATSSWLSSQYALPMRLSELGASAGLNLMFDKFALDIEDSRYGANEPALVLSPNWRGERPPLNSFRIVERSGVDLSPIGATSTEGRLRLLAYLWPDQHDRLERTDAAISVFDANVDKGDAADWLETREMLREGTLHLIYHTVAWQYFPDEAKDRVRAKIEASGTGATERSPLAWLGMEWDGDDKGAAMTLRLWPGDRAFALGRIDFHGRWVDWNPQIS